MTYEDRRCPADERADMADARILFYRTFAALKAPKRVRWDTYRRNIMRLDAASLVAA